MKVKIFQIYCNETTEKFTDKINKFIEDKKIHDIKFQAYGTGILYVMVIYLEGE